MSADPLEMKRLHELGEFLRSRRARISPEQAGLPHGARRRTPGLRRGEVALLAGVSPEWYTWLEQGRDIQPSVQVLGNVANVLQLDATERDHLFLLAAGQPPPVEIFRPPPISPAIRQLLDQFRLVPACAVDARLTVIGWNAAYCAVFGDFTALVERERNLIWRLFTLPATRRTNKQWEALAQSYLAQFRAGYGRFIKDPWWETQITELSRVSPEFRELWSHRDVENVSEGQKTMLHSRTGELTFDFLWLQAVDSSGLRLLIHMPHPNTGTAESMERLLANTSDDIG